ncbi:MAG: hypothetical protein ACOCP8_05135 [archaeon]
MNMFQQQIIKEVPEIQKEDFMYFIDETVNKLKKMNLPAKNCNINFHFIDAKEKEYVQLEYCLKNCGLKCILNNGVPKDRKIKK